MQTEDGLIDPLNEDTYDSRVIMQTGIRTKVPNNAYRKGWEKAFGPKWTFIIKVKTWNVKYVVSL